jgi:hypothetical protein
VRARRPGYSGGGEENPRQSADLLESLIAIRYWPKKEVTPGLILDSLPAGYR